MSRGSGRVQRAILDRLEVHGPMQANELCWQLADAEGKIRIDGEIAEIRQGAIVKPFYSAFNRALSGLREKGKVTVVPTKLTGLDEVIRVYPFKTTDLATRELREKLLPAIPAYLTSLNKNRWKRREKFSLTENESYLVGMLSEDERQAFRHKWKGLEPQLFDLMSALRDDPKRRDLVLRVIQRGRGLFGVGVGHDPAALESLLQALSSVSLTPQEESVYRAVSSVYRSAIPERQARRARLKTQLYAVAYFGAKTPVRLNHEFVTALSLSYPFIQQLPGHQPAESRWNREVQPTTFSPMLNRLFDRTVFSSFNFISFN